MTLHEFERDVFTTALSSPICDIPFVRRLTATMINLRIPILTQSLADGSFVDVFYNEHTGTTAYALIEQGQRIFGADNTGGWHVHPFHAPSQHVPVQKAMTFAGFITEIEQQV